VFIVLALLLRSIVAPLMLLGTVVVSYFAALGGANLLFEHAFGFNGVDYGLPLLGFVFLVSLGVDYNIFLMHRVREETARLGHRRGVLTALTGTGSVITSAGLVLAATFMVMGTLPLTPLVELGVLVAFGVLLDTFLVRSIIVPALALDLGEKLWWPAKPHPAKPTEHRILTTV
jgi:RND superfamily putative drug exporter